MGSLLEDILFVETRNKDTREYLVTGEKTPTITAGFNNVLIAPRVEPKTTFRLQGFGVSNALTGVSLVLPAGKGPVNVLASGGTTTIVMDTSNLPEDDGEDGGSGNENPDEDLGDLGEFRLLSDENQADYYASLQIGCLQEESP